MMPGMSRFAVFPLPFNQQVVLPEKVEKFISTKIWINRVNIQTKHKIQLLAAQTWLQTSLTQNHFQKYTL
jgi:hypothetical protein